MSLHPSLLIRDSVRYWTRKPWQAALSVFLLAVGSAAVAILWTITDVVVRKPLPFPDSQELYGIQSVDEKTGKEINFMALADFRDFRERQTSFDGLFAYRGDFLNYREKSGTTRQLFASRVTRDFATTLRIRPEIGSLFRDEDFATDGSGAAIISYDLWQREFSGKQEAIGTSMWFDDKVYEVIGVMPKSYNEPASADVWTPFPDVTGEYFVRDSRYWNVVGRLKPGVGLGSATQEVQQIARSLAETYPDTNKSRGADLESMRTMIVGDYSTPLVLILVAVSLVMFATCLNLANLQLISGLQRSSEVGIRQAIGESQQQAFGRVLMESAVLCLVGCGLGWAIAALFIRNIDRIVPEMFLPRLHEVSLTGSLGWTILVIALVASVSFGLLPAIQSARANTNEILKSGESRHGLSVGSRRSRNTLLALQIAVAVLILHGALLVIYEYKRLQKADLGFASNDLTMVTISPGESRMFDLPGLSLYYDEIIEWLESRDQVLAATSASSPPLWGFDMESVFQLQGHDLLAERDEAVTASYNSVSRNFLDTMGIKVTAGRNFNEWDTQESQRVAMVNQAFVDEYLHGMDPLSQQVMIQPWMEPRFRQVVGVVGDYTQLNLTDEPKPQIYVPASQTPWIFTTLILRTRGASDAWNSQLEVEMKQKYPDLGVTMTSMDELLERHLSMQSVMYALFVGFGAATVMLSLFGIGSQMAFNVSERAREWGIRLAMGATARQLNLLVVRNLMKPLFSGILIGLAFFSAGYQLHASFGQSSDPVFMLSSAATLMAIVAAGGITTWLVSTRITRGEPQDILKAL